MVCFYEIIDRFLLGLSAPKTCRKPSQTPPKILKQISKVPLNLPEAFKSYPTYRVPLHAETFIVVNRETHRFFDDNSAPSRSEELPGPEFKHYRRRTEKIENWMFWGYVWKIFGGILGRVWRIFGVFLGGFWRVFWGVLRGNKTYKFSYKSFQCPY